jgi:hypothetical protein
VVGWAVVGWVVGIASEQVEGVGEEGKDCAEGAFGTARVAGKIDEQSLTGDAADASAEGGEGCVECAVLADELGEAGDEAIADGEGGFGCDVAGGKAGAAGGENESGSGGCGAEGGNEGFELVGKDLGIEQLDASRGEDIRECWTGEVGLGACRAAIADGDDDGGSAGEGGLVGHVSRIDADARNRAEDEKMERPACFGLVICCGWRNLHPG